MRARLPINEVNIEVAIPSVSTIAKLRNQGFRARLHGRERALVRVRPRGLASAWLSTNTRHLAYLRLTASTSLAIVYRVISN